MQRRFRPAKLDRPEAATAHLAEIDRLEDHDDRMLREGLTALF